MGHGRPCVPNSAVGLSSAGRPVVVLGSTDGKADLPSTSVAGGLADTHAWRGMMADVKSDPDAASGASSPTPRVDLGSLDDKRLEQYRHPYERHSLVAIAVGFAIALVVLWRSVDVARVLPALGLYGFAAYRLLPAVQVWARRPARYGWAPNRTEIATAVECSLFHARSVDRAARPAGNRGWPGLDCNQRTSR